MTTETTEKPDDGILDALRGKDVAEMPDLPEELRGKTPEELQGFVEVLDVHLRAIHQTDEGELRDKTPEEQKAFEYGLKLRDKALARLDEHRAIAEVFRRKPKGVEQIMSGISRGIDDVFGDVTRMTTGEARDKALRVLDDRNSSRHMADDEKAQTEEWIRKDTHTARRVLVTENEHYREAWRKLLMGQPEALEDDERKAVRAWYEFRAASEGSTTAGGFGVPVFIDPSIILTGQSSANPFLRIARQETITTNQWKGVSSAGVTWSFDAEAARVSDDSPTIAQPAVPIYTARGFIPFSIEVGEDYPGFASEMSRLLGEGYDELLADKFARGSGSGEPTGIITALDANTNVEVAVTTDGSFGVVDVYKVWKSVPEKWRLRASWLMSVDVNNLIRQMGTANVYHGATVDLTAGAADVILGKQVYESSYFPDFTGSTTTAANTLVVGDFSNYLIARRGGMSVEFVPTLFQQQTAGSGFGLPTGQRGWFAYARVGGNSINDLAFRILQV
jgi:HK97 family phage major capsid protein